jgi:hypothetical protein
MIYWRRVLILSLLMGCGRAAVESPGAPVTVEGTAPDVARLRGRWAGEFHADSGDRHGKIAFVLAADSDTAFGKITLQAAPPAPHCVDPARPHAYAEVNAPIVLQIEALGTAKGSVGGWMRPHDDPVAGCWVATWFEGRLVRDTLAGAYFSQRANGDPIRTGTWWVARQSR